MMELTDEQVAAIKPLLKRMLEAKHAEWDAQRQIEALLDTEFDAMGAALNNIAPTYTDPATEVTDADVRDYIADCRPPEKKRL